MKLLYIHQHFVTNEGASGTRSYDVSKYLVEMDHQVTMVCGLNDYSTQKKPRPWQPFSVEWLDGIKLVTCNARYSNKQKVPARILAFVKFATLATWACLRERSVDLIFPTSTPLTVGIPGRIAATLKRVPYVFEVRDLWPEDLLAADRLRPGLQYKVWEWLEKFCYAKARRILLVSRGFHDRLLERGFAPERLETILLGADGRLFEKVSPDRKYIADHGLDGKTLAIYTGAHGDANGLFQLIEAAEQLRNRADIAIVLIGDGKMKTALEKAVADKGLTNVVLLDPVPKHQLPGILAACQIGLMILKQISRPRWVTPNKIFDYMFTGIPTIVNFPGTTAEMVQQDGSGLVSEPGSARDLADKIIYLADRPEERAAIGRRAREVAWQKYDRRMIAESLARVFETVLAEVRR